MGGAVVRDTRTKQRQRGSPKKDALFISLKIFIFYFFKDLLIYFRARVHGWEEAEGERQSLVADSPLSEEPIADRIPGL